MNGDKEKYEITPVPFHIVIRCEETGVVRVDGVVFLHPTTFKVIVQGVYVPKPHAALLQWICEGVAQSFAGQAQ